MFGVPRTIRVFVPPFPIEDDKPMGSFDEHHEYPVETNRSSRIGVFGIDSGPNGITQPGLMIRATQPLKDHIGFLNRFFDEPRVFELPFGAEVANLVNL